MLYALLAYSAERCGTALGGDFTGLVSVVYLDISLCIKASCALNLLGGTVLGGDA